MNSTFLKACTSVGLLTTPCWAELVSAFSTTMQFISVTTGAAIGVLTLYRMLRLKGYIHGVRN